MGVLIVCPGCDNAAPPEAYRVGDTNVAFCGKCGEAFNLPDGKDPFEETPDDDPPPYDPADVFGRP